MKSLKNTFFLVLLLSITLSSYAQKPFKVIHKAERKFENGQNKRALKLLSKAEKMNLGFCGTWDNRDKAINLLRAKIYVDQKEYQLARNSIDSIAFWSMIDNLDSIIIRTYQMEYGKDSLSNMVDSSLINTKVVCRDYDCYALIPLTNGKEIKMKISISNPNLRYLNDNREKAEEWIKEFKESENYKLIKEKG